jgi:hypothetical protein
MKIGCACTMLYCLLSVIWLCIATEEEIPGQLISYDSCSAYKGAADNCYLTMKSFFSLPPTAVISFAPDSGTSGTTAA